MFAFFNFRDGRTLDLESLLRGDLRVVAEPPLRAISVVTRAEYRVDRRDLEVLSAVPVDRWVETADLSANGGASSDQIGRLARQGLLLADADDDLFRELRRREELLREQGWDPYAALFHFLTQWSDENLGLPVEMAELVDAVRRNADTLYRRARQQHGPPPPPFHERHDATGRIELPPVEHDTPLVRTLSRRRTVREFDERTALELSELSTVLYYVFGCQGHLPISGDLVLLKKTSPSGGALHPTEVYPLVLRVAGLEPGLYHYNVGNHGLERLLRTDLSEARRLANEFTAGQSFPGGAHVLMILTTRFYRNLWKYRNHRRTYGVLLMDAAHLSQTFYLVCADLGLGAFVTAGINGRNIERRLGLDGFEEGPLAICGCGRPSTEPEGLDPEFLPYRPGA